MERVPDDAPLAALVQKFNLELQKCREQKLQADQISMDSSRNIDRYEGAILGVKEAAKIIAENNKDLIEEKTKLQKSD